MVTASPAAASAQHVQLVVNGRSITVDAQGGSLLELLRQQGHTAVKHACGEGGCGACAVLVSSDDGQADGGCCGGGGARTVNACLMPVYAADGCHITTADGLPRNNDGVNPVAERLVGFFGSQCGFCTPGMAVACHAALSKAAAQGRALSAVEMRDGLDGNLCRCTGYRPIVDACKSFACDVDMEDLGFNMFTSKGQPLPEPAPAHMPASPAAGAPRNLASEPAGEEPAADAVVHVAAAHPGAPAGSPGVLPLKMLQLPGSQQVVYVPHTMEQLLQAVQQHAVSGVGAPLRVVAGNTGPGVYKDWPLTDPALLYIKQVQELQGVHLVPDPQQPQQVVVRVGSAATLAEVVDMMGAWCRQGQGAAAGQALAAQQPPSKGLAGQEAALRVAGVWLEVVSHLKRVAGSHVRGAATLVGNLVLARSQGLPSDVATLLLAAGASVEMVQLRPGSSSNAAKAEPQRVPLAQYLAKGTAAVADGAAAAAAGSVAKEVESREAGLELMTAALIPVPAEGSRFWSSRVAARWSNAASVINAAALWPGDPTAAAAGGSPCAPSFVLGMNLAHEHGPEQWRVAHCTAVEQALQQGGSLTPQLATVALAALSEDLSQLFGLPPPAAANEAAAANSTPAEHHFAYLRSVAEGLLLQALAGLLSSTETAVNGTSATTSAGATDMPAADGVMNGVNGVNCSSNGRSNGSSNVSAATAGGAAVLQAARKLAPPAVASGKQMLLAEDPALAPLTQAWPKESAHLQASGQAQYSDDVPLGPGALFAAWVPAKVAAGKVKHIDTSAALAVPGAVRFVGVEDLPVPDVAPGMEPIFSSDIQFYGQPVGLLLATSYQAAHHAARLVVVECEAPAQPPVLDPQQAVAQGSVYPLALFLPQYPPGRTEGSICMGKADVSKELAACPLRLSGLKWHLPSQAHMYMEPQTAVAEVEEDGCVRVHSSTQNLDMVLLAVAGALGLPHHKVEVKCRRLGGGFGGKTTHPNSVAAAAAVAAMVTGKQVHLATERTTDLAMFGGRCEVDTTFDVGFDQEGRILALDMDTVLQAGAYVGWSFFDAEGWANTGDSVYDVPALRLQFTLARTNTLPRSSVRGPGHFPGMVAMESVVECVAAHLGLDPALVRERNLRQPVPAGQPFTNGVGKALGPPDTYTMPRIWKELKESTNYQARVADVAAFNAAHTWVKRGLSLMPCMFPLSSWTRNALVHIYVDGSVRVVHPGVDMGQGLGVKVQQTAAYELSKVLPASQRPLPLSLIRLADPSTFSLPHNALTGGSTVSDAACAAVRAACAELVSRLRPHAEQMGDGCTWQALIGKLNVIPGLRNIVDLTAGGEANLAPDAGGAPIVGPVYTSFGAALAEAEVDVLTGDRRVVRVDILMDVGKTLNPGVDLGQVEGAFMFGTGFMLHEEVGLDPATGRVTTNTTWHYKVPGAHCVPAQFNVAMLKDSPLPFEGPLGAKSVGEPPLLLSCSVAFALAAAARAAAQQVYGQAPAPQPLQLPLLPQRIKQLCGTQPLQQVIERVAAA